MSDANGIENLPRAHGPSTGLRLVVLGAFLALIATIWMLPLKEETPPPRLADTPRFMLPPPWLQAPAAVRQAQATLKVACRDWIDAGGVFLSLDGVQKLEEGEARVCTELLRPGAAEGRSFTTGIVAGAFGSMAALIILSALRALLLWLWRLPDRVPSRDSDRV